jgi:hypothetical protein
MATSHDAISPQEAAGAIQFFFAGEGRWLEPQEVITGFGTPEVTAHPDLGALLSFRGSLGAIEVSPRGSVVYYAGDALPALGQPPAEGDLLSRSALMSERATESISLARDFVSRHVKDFAGRCFIEEPARYDFPYAMLRWVEKVRPDAETAIFPNWVEVVVNLELGRVERFDASDLRLARTTSPRISEAQARALIRGRFERAAVEEIELMQLPFKGESEAITVWTVLVMTLGEKGPEHVRVTLDADSGELLP